MIFNAMRNVAVAVVMAEASVAIEFARVPREFDAAPVKI